LIWFNGLFNFVDLFVKYTLIQHTSTPSFELDRHRLLRDPPAQSGAARPLPQYKKGLSKGKAMFVIQDL